MTKIACIAGLATALVTGLATALVLSPSWQSPEEVRRSACIQRCVVQRGGGEADPELQRQEIISLEREAAHAIQLNSGTFFHRVYSDDFAATLSHGQQVNKDQCIKTIESPLVEREM